MQSLYDIVNPSQSPLTCTINKTYTTHSAHWGLNLEQPIIRQQHNLYSTAQTTTKTPIPLLLYTHLKEELTEMLV